MLFAISSGLSGEKAQGVSLPEALTERSTVICLHTFLAQNHSVL